MTFEEVRKPLALGSGGVQDRLLTKVGRPRLPVTPQHTDACRLRLGECVIGAVPVNEREIIGVAGSGRQLGPGALRFGRQHGGVVEVAHRETQPGEVSQECGGET